MNKTVLCRKCGIEMELVNDESFDEDLSASSYSPTEEDLGTFPTTAAPPEPETVIRTYKCPKCGLEQDSFSGPV